MSKKSTLKLNTRKITGRKVKQLRRQDIIPANIFGKKIKSQAVKLSVKDFEKALKEVGETGVIHLTLGSEKKERPSLISHIQRDPVTDQVLHIDFQQVDLTVKITTEVPIEITGKSVAVKEKAGILITLMDAIQVEALPTDLPESIAVDISGMNEFGDSITVADLKAPPKVTIITEKSQTIVQVQEPKEEEPEPVVEEVEGDEGEPEISEETEAKEESKSEESSSEEKAKEPKSKKESK